MSIATLVVEYQAQTFKGEKFRPIFSSINKASPTYNQKGYPRVFLDLFDALNLAVVFVCP